MTEVTIVEVAPRDGFQAVKPFIPTETKIALIEELAACGFERMEIGSFVSPKAIAQMADIGDILARARLPKSLIPQVLVPNRKGFEAALAAGIKEIGWVLSVSEAHNQSNVRRSVDQSFNDLEACWRDVGGPHVEFRLNLATSFDCPFDGKVDEAKVIACVERGLSFLGPKLQIGIADTTGRAAPTHVASLFGELMRRFDRPGITFIYHGHDTYGLGVANAFAAYEVGLRTFDAAAAGLGGCPFAPGATGNTASEDLVFAFEHAGIGTGIDLERLMKVAERVKDIAPVQSGGRLLNVPRERVLKGIPRYATAKAA
jgi:hydroxymethylglutaryl-CoA lyase